MCRDDSPTRTNLILVCFPALCPARLQSLPACLDNMAQARLPGKNGSDTIQHHRWNFIFFGQTKTAIQDLLTTHIPISLVSYISFAWVRQGKHCVKPFLITEACVSSVPRPCAPVSPSPATTPLLQHDGLSYRGPK